MREKGSEKEKLNGFLGFTLLKGEEKVP